MSSPETPEWVSDAVFYQVFPDRFARSARVPKPAGLEPWGAPPSLHGYQGGDLWGVVEHFDHLSDVGVNALSLNPVFASASNHRYHTHDYLHVDPMLGGDDALRALLDAAHERGWRVVLDGVFNHASRGFLPFNDLLENGPASPWVDWFRVGQWPLHAYDESQPAGYACWWGLRALPQLNHDNPHVREFVMRVAEHWIAYGADGWRLDVPSEITAPGFWAEFRSRVKAVNPDAYLVGEIWVDATEWLQGDQFDGVMNYAVTGPTIAYTAGDRVEPAYGEGRSYRIAPALGGAQWADAVEAVIERHPLSITLSQLNLLDGHDTARLTTICGGDRASVELATALLFTLPGAPCIYYGDEIGLAGGLDPDCRRAFPWDAPEAWDHDRLALHRQLVALRHAHEALRRGTFARLVADDAVVVFVRRHGDAALVVAINAADHERTVAVDPDLLPAQVVWTNATAGAQAADGALVLPPRSATVSA